MGVTDDTAAIQAAINTNKVAYLPKPAVSYRLTSTLTVASGQALIGLDVQPTLLVDHGGDGILVTNRGYIENLTLTASIGSRYVYTGVAVGAFGVDNTYGHVKNIFVVSPKTGIHMRGAAYWYTVTDIQVYGFKEYGIFLDSGPNNNYIQFKHLASSNFAGIGLEYGQIQRNMLLAAVF